VRMRILPTLVSALFVAGATAVAAAPGAAAIPGFASCPSPAGHQIEIAGDITCEDAVSAVDGYDWDGEKVQFIGGFDCYSAPDDVRPIVLICADGNDEVVMSLT
jgi:hypothetical protein